MLKFGSKLRQNSRAKFRERWHLWMLVFFLGTVIVAMQRITAPASVERLDRLFNRQTTVSQSAVTSAPVRPVAPDIDLSDVEDNTYFRSAEHTAWFALLGHLRDTDAARLAAVTLGEISYAQLVQQPGVYRGKVVTLRGTVLREEPQQPEENLQAITGYHRLWLRPLGGGQWPFVVYVLVLPPEFPRGDQLGENVSATGIFFKNWSYRHDDGLGIAPVVLAANIDWQPRPAPIPAPAVSTEDVVWVLTGALVLATTAVWLIVRRTAHRPRSTAHLPASLAQPADWGDDFVGSRQQ